MRKIIKYSLLVFIIIVLCSIVSHKHNYDEVVYEATYNQYGYIEYICECGYSYKDQYVSPLNTEEIYRSLNKYQEDEKLKKKLVFNNYKCENEKEISVYNYAINNEYIYIPIPIQEKVYIVFSRFRGLL